MISTLHIPADLQAGRLRRLCYRTLYIGIRPQTVTLWCYETNRLYQDTPVLVRHDERLLFGQEALDCAQRLGLDSYNPLDHPRVVVDDTEALGLFLYHGATQVLGQRWPLVRTYAIVHYLEAVVEGLAQIEKQALRQACRRLKMQHICLLEADTPLSESQLIAFCQDIASLQAQLGTISA
jgi:hypothetical protein